MDGRRIWQGVAVLLVPLIGIVATSPPRADAGPELVSNGSVEIAGANPALPQGFNQGGWGTNTRALSYPSTGGHTGARFTRIVMSNYATGDAKWWFNQVTVTPSTSYTFRDWYRSTFTTLLVAEVRSTAGVTSWIWLRNLPAATAWTEAAATFTTPANTASATVYHLIQGNGTLDTDDTSFSSNVGVPPTTVPPTTVPPTTVPPTTVPPTTVPPTTVSPTTVPPTTVPPPSGGLIANPSVESVNPTNPALPQSWGQGGWGTNARAFAYPTGGARSGSRFTRVTVTSYTSGDAKWFFPHVNVAPNTSYTFSDWYRSGVTTQLVAEFRSSSGAVSYSVPVNVPPSSNWSPSTWVFSTPASTTSVTIYHLIGSVGTLDTDDTSLSLTTGVPPPPPPPPTTTPPTTTPPTTVPPTTVPPGNRPIVYLTFDDGPGPDYTPAMIDMLGRYGVRATFFILGQNVRSFPSVTAQVIQRGHAIGNHTDTHPDLTTLTSAQIASQLTTSGDSIFAAAGVRPKCMRPPYGRLNATATSTIASLGLSTIMWTHDTRDWDTAVTSVGSIVNTLNTVSNGSIVLMHDFAPNTIIAVDQWLAANVSRFEFRTIPSC